MISHSTNFKDRCAVYKDIRLNLCIWLNLCVCVTFSFLLLEFLLEMEPYNLVVGLFLVCFNLYSVQQTAKDGCRNNGPHPHPADGGGFHRQLQVPLAVVWISVHPSGDSFLG